MGKPIIGITSNEKPVADGIAIMNLSVSRNFADGIKRAGGGFLFISPCLVKRMLSTMCRRLISYY